MQSYDYIIIGAGSAGSVLASRLSENPHISVCLLEAGVEDKHPAIHIPFGLALVSTLSSIKWDYTTHSETHLNNREMYWPRGKTLGGSSSINAMCYIRGHADNYNQWAQQSASHWDWNSVLPYFRKSENNTRGISRLHGCGGPQGVSDLKHVNKLTLDFVSSSVNTGIIENPDFNGIRQEGVGVYQVTQQNGSRCSTAKGFLKPAVRKRSNLTILTQANVKKIIIEQARAKGVSVTVNGEHQNITANIEVLLCAGAIGSPQILMQSGIGPEGHLKELGIDVVEDLPGVGRNLQDHLDGTIVYKQRNYDSYGISVPGILKNALAPLQYWQKKEGMLTSNIAEGGAFIKSSPDKSLPDIQVHFIPALLLDHGRKRLTGHGFTIHFCNLYPKSKGSVTLQKTSSGFEAIIKANYLSHVDDLAPMIAGFKWAQDVANTAPLGNTAMPYSPNTKLESDEDIVEYIKNNAETVYHPVGTCKMGKSSDAEAVVSDELKVFGVNALRVVDASIMPNIIGGNTNAPTIMIAEKAAEMIQKDAAKN
ncbi:GMC family oxidoreductase [Glaciecola sp. 2405UD65-10]|uniref:GMC family oxidoreductase n=1 Tax=Glaciecola sp. 2405UD65-10 TaxID=3397244 RepID=UPI003B5AB269